MPWTRKPARSRWTRPQTIAGAATALVAAFAFLAGLTRRRATTADEPAAALPTTPNGATTRPGTVTPAIQEPTSDREPDEIDKLARLEPTQTATSKRR